MDPDRSRCNTNYFFLQCYPITIGNAVFVKLNHHIFGTYVAMITLPHLTDGDGDIILCGGIGKSRCTTIGLAVSFIQLMAKHGDGGWVQEMQGALNAITVIYKLYHISTQFLPS
jgi:hypothetical protein